MYMSVKATANTQIYERGKCVGMSLPDIGKIILMLRTFPYAPICLHSALCSTSPVATT